MGPLLHRLSVVCSIIQIVTLVLMLKFCLFMASDTDSVKFEANFQLFYNVILTEICVLVVLFKMKITKMLSNTSKSSL